MSEWVDNFLKKHAQAIHPNVLDRVNHRSSPQENIDRFKRELVALEQKQTSVNMQDENSEREYRWNCIVIRETCMLIEALEEELKP